MLRIKRHKFIWFGIIVLGVILFGMPSVYAKDVQPLPDPAADAAKLKAEQDYKAALEEIAVNKEAVIEELVSTWFMNEPGWEEDFRSILELANDSKLLAVSQAGSYAEVQAILGGGTAANYSPGSMATPLTLGDPDQDLVFTPVTPCKIVDTRAGGGGFISSFQTRNYFVHGNLSSQGGSICNAPRGDPRAVHISLIAVGPNGKGNLQVFPKGGSPGAGLSVNYAPIGTNLANAGTTKTAYLVGEDITVTSRYAGCHAVINVLGYYYDAEPEKVTAVASTGTQTTGYTVGTSYTTLVSKTVDIPTNGHVILMGEASFYNSGGSNFLGCKFLEGTAQVDFWWWDPGDNDGYVDLHQTRFFMKTVTPGTKTYWLQCYRSGGTTNPHAYYRNLTVQFIKEGM